MVEVTVCENGQKVLVRRGYQERPEETYTVAITELHHDKENIGSIFEGLLYVRNIKIKEVRSPEGGYIKLAILKI